MARMTLWCILGILIFVSHTSFSQHLNIFFYNTYNLFDNQKDPGKDDWTWLPTGYPGKDEACKSISNPFYRKECFETNWTNQHVALKISQLRTAITGNKRENVPDILGLAEVENAKIVRALARSMGYDQRAVITTDSPDIRGIDVALVYKPSAHLRYRSHREHKVPLYAQTAKATRNILEVEFIVGGKEQLFIYVNHWPSQGSPSQARLTAATTLKSVINARLAQNPKANILAMGDFNTVPNDRPHPFTDLLLLPGKQENSQLYDVHSTFMDHPQIPSELKQSQPLGTYYYVGGKEWNLLDRFFVNKNLFDGQGLDFAIINYRIHAPQFLSQPYTYKGQTFLIPFRGNTQTLDYRLAGYSDHYAIRASLTIK